MHQKRVKKEKAHNSNSCAYCLSFITIKYLFCCLMNHIFTDKDLQNHAYNRQYITEVTLPNAETINSRLSANDLVKWNLMHNNWPRQRVHLSVMANGCHTAVTAARKLGGKNKRSTAASVVCEDWEMPNRSSFFQSSKDYLHKLQIILCCDCHLVVAENIKLLVLRNYMTAAVISPKYWKINKQEI